MTEQHNRGTCETPGHEEVPATHRTEHELTWQEWRLAYGIRRRNTLDRLFDALGIEGRFRS